MTSATSLGVGLTTLKPRHVILMEPHLDYIRALEVHSAERKLAGDLSDLAVVMIRYNESTELYQHLSAIEQEKRSFNDLVSINEQLSTRADTSMKTESISN